MALVARTDLAASVAALAREEQDKRRNQIKIYTIAYGDDANFDVLKSIADATQGRAYKGTPQNIKSVIKDIATFF